MAVGTHSIIYYGYTITNSNKFLNFDEGGGELTATLAVGAYSLTELLTVIKTAMDAVSTLPQAYTITVDRDTRKITIASDATFDLLISSGSQTGSSPWTLMGFTGSVDLTGAITYTSDDASGDFFIPQMEVQDFTDSENRQELISPSVNESANGEIEVVSFGVRKFLTMSFKLITDKPADGVLIRNNTTGVADAQRFLQDATQKRPFEFMVDIDSRSSFKKCLLESTPTNAQGVGYELRELVRDGMPGYYEINNLRVRVLT